MNAGRLLAHFEEIAEAADAIPHLRRFIRDLAVRGKLVPQDSKDEPAAKLLTQIIAERSRLLPPRPRDRGELIEATHQRDLPRGWSWATLGTLIELISGQHLTPSEYSADSGVGLPYITGPADFGKKGLSITRFALVRKAVAKQGQLLLTVKGSGIGKMTTCDLAEVAISRQLMALTALGWNARFLVLVTYQLARRLQAAARSLIPGISREDIENFTFALPPLAEQHRIVVKVDELMAHCDRLEVSRKEREERRGRLTTTGLARLNRPNSEASQRDARFVIDSLPSLTTRSESIAELRHTLLNLGVRGKLVVQDADDQPASALLGEIRARIGATHTDKFATCDAHLPFRLPNGWTWATFPELGAFGRGRSKHRPRNDPSLFVGGQHLMIQTGDVARSGGYIQTYTGKYNDQGLAQSRKWPKGTLCITIAANIADTGILSFDACFPDSVVGFIPAPPFKDARYFEYFLRTAKARLLEFAPATAQKNINLEILSQVQIPLPPLAEIDRIVVRLDELMTLCDQLDRNLVAAYGTRSRLLNTLLAEALRDSSDAIAA